MPDIENLGFCRKEFGASDVHGTVELYDTHIFICTLILAKDWPSKLEKVEGPYTRLKAAIETLKDRISGDVKITLFNPGCEEDLEGDVLVFPISKRFRGGILEQKTCQDFVESGLVPLASAPGRSCENIKCRPDIFDIFGAHVFVCCHTQRDARCSACGPTLVTSFQASAKGYQGLKGGRVTVRACSHLGGHKYAGVMVMFNSKGEGFWYGYVSPKDTHAILHAHVFSTNTVVARLWRGQLGVEKEVQANKAKEMVESQRGFLENERREPSALKVDVKQGSNAANASTSSLNDSFTSWTETCVLATSFIAILSISVSLILKVRK